MGPKPIQDVKPLAQTANPPTEPQSGPEIVADIPVRSSVGHGNDEQKPNPPKNDDSSFIVPATPAAPATNKDQEKPRTQAGQPKPTSAIIVALLAAVCLAAGAYLKFFSNN